MIFDAMKLKHENLNHAPLLKINLIDNGRLFEDSRIDLGITFDDSLE